jgi:hypothetical protein
MKIVLTVFLIGICPALLHADEHSGQLAPAILDKAAAILEHTDVFATRSLFCHSEPCEESPKLKSTRTAEIPRTARNDRKI